MIPEASIPALMELCKKNHVEVSNPITLPRVLDALIGHYIEPQCVQPTFIINHPKVMSPLAKEHEHSGKSERFELFANGVELINAYTEQNNPVVGPYSIFSPRCRKRVLKHKQDNALMATRRFLLRI